MPDIRTDMEIEWLSSAESVLCVLAMLKLNQSLRLVKTVIEISGAGLMPLPVDCGGEEDKW